MSDSASIFFFERYQHIGVVGPHSEASITIECLPLARGLFKFADVRVVENNPSVSTKPLIFVTDTQFEVFVS
jgi:hypothetical protein